jgi:hypothetical protein
MFGSAVLDVAVGLALVYFFFSLVCSALREGMARMLGERERGLIRGMYRLLGEEPPASLLTIARAPAPAAPTSAQTVDAPAINLDEHTLVRRILDHGLLRSHTTTDKKLPTYVTSRAFALALLDSIAPTGQHPRTVQAVRSVIERVPNARIQQALLPLVMEAGDDFVALQGAIEKQFDGAMSEIARWYKRHSQMWIAIFALIVSFVFNIDSIAVSKTLWREPTVRAHVVAMAATTKAPEANSGTAAEVLDAYRQSNEALRTLEMPMGWEHPPQTTRDWVMKVAGCLITALALLLGAPFWFEVLSKFMSPRVGASKPGD